jgi:osmoprotectant transport system substrate-binding protein
MKKNAKTLIALLLAVMVGGFAFGGAQKEGSKAKKVRIGSKDFTESFLLAEIYALALEDAGIPVDRNLGLASSVVHTTLVSNAIDLYPEYTGTGLLAILKLSKISDPAEVYRVVKEAYKKQFDIVWLNYAEANDSQGIVISRKAADAYGIRTITDLQRNAEQLRIAARGSFYEREDALPGLALGYGPFNWKSTGEIADSLKWQLLLSDEIDVSSVSTTEGYLAEPQFLLLEDDKHVWPPYNIAPVIRQDALDRYPEIADILNKVNAKIDTSTITNLNAEVDLKKREYAEVAKEFYDSIKGK